jgi:hypothetical protein
VIPDPTAIRFTSPAWLLLLTAPGLLLLLWSWQLSRRQRDRRRFRRARRFWAPGSAQMEARRPGSERIPLFGDLLAWLCLILALGATILALARPILVTSSLQSAGIDLVILQDGSASMRVEDVPGTRWQRSMRFLRVLGESLRWENDRLALALFANIAMPQIRLTRDPNTFFFFLDHLDIEPPFRVQDQGSWDTNIERGIYWGLRLVEKDEEIRGPSDNAAAFVLLSDGQAWSGEVERSIRRARERDIPLYVIGVGTTAGGIIPEPVRAAGDRPVASVLDRTSLAVIATAGGGRYFELDRERDADIANAIIASTRARATARGVAEGGDDLYWYALASAAAWVLLGVLSYAFR